MTKIVAIIQARMKSTRLPGKVIKTLPYGSDKTVLDRVIHRTKAAASISEIVVATTESSDDDTIVARARDNDVAWFRGSENDVLSRYYYAAAEHHADVVVRITSDCPCLDYREINRGIEYFLESDIDYLCNTLHRTYPHGLDFEVFAFDALKKAHETAIKESEREHVTLHIYTSGKYRLYNLEAPVDLQAPDIRITLDTLEDYALLCAVYDYLYEKNNMFELTDIINLFKQRPWLKLINQNIIHKKVFSNLNDEISEAIKILDIQGLQHAKQILETYRQ